MWTGSVLLFSEHGDYASRGTDICRRVHESLFGLTQEVSYSEENTYLDKSIKQSINEY